MIFFPICPILVDSSGNFLTPKKYYSMETSTLTRIVQVQRKFFFGDFRSSKVEQFF